MHRRNAIKVGLGGLNFAGATGPVGQAQDQASDIEENSTDRQISTRPGGASQPEIVDKVLAEANNGLYFMFQEELSTQLAQENYELIITSARDAYDRPTSMRVRSRSAAFFRVDATFDEFTRTGGWYWKCGDQEGQLEFNNPENVILGSSSESAGPLVMVVRRGDNSVQWYLLSIDLRC